MFVCSYVTIVTKINKTDRRPSDACCEDTLRTEKQGGEGKQDVYQRRWVQTKICHSTSCSGRVFKANSEVTSASGHHSQRGFQTQRPKKVHTQWSCVLSVSLTYIHTYTLYTHIQSYDVELCDVDLIVKACMLVCTCQIIFPAALLMCSRMNVCARPPDTNKIIVCFVTTWISVWMLTT